MYRGFSAPPTFFFPPIRPSAPSAVRAPTPSGIRDPFLGSRLEVSGWRWPAAYALPLCLPPYYAFHIYIHCLLCCKLIRAPIARPPMLWNGWSGHHTLYRHSFFVSLMFPLYFGCWIVGCAVVPFSVLFGRQSFLLHAGALGPFRSRLPPCAFFFWSRLWRLFAWFVPAAAAEALYSAWLAYLAFAPDNFSLFA